MSNYYQTYWSIFLTITKTENTCKRQEKTYSTGDSTMKKMMGNAVTTKVMESVAARIRSALMLQNESS